MSLPRLVKSFKFTVNRKKEFVNCSPRFACEAGQLSTVNCSPKTGFTLIELLVVISIIGILMAVATVSYINAQQKGRDNKRKSDLKAIQQALELYFQQNGKYPYQQSDTDGITGRIACANTPNTAVKWGTALTCGSVTYMNPLPKDPSYTPASLTDYYYSSSSPNTSYILSAKLENLKDKENADNPGYPASPTLPCTPQGYTVPNANGTTKSYCVVNP